MFLKYDQIQKITLYWKLEDGGEKLNTHICLDAKNNKNCKAIMALWRFDFCFW